MSQPSDLTPKEAAVVEEFSSDIGVESVAAIYAKALVGATDSAGVTEAVRADFDGVAELLAGQPRLVAVLGSPLIPVEERTALVDRLFRERVAPLLLNFLKVVAAHDRLELLRAIHHQAKILWDERLGRVRVELRTAVPLDAAALARVTDQLQQMLGRQPVVRHRVEPDLIGGALVRVGDTVYDGSIAAQLNILRQQIVDRSVHEIQSRRDRLGPSAGN